METGLGSRSRSTWRQGWVQGVNKHESGLCSRSRLTWRQVCFQVDKH